MQYLRLFISSLSILSLCQCSFLAQYQGGNDDQENGALILALAAGQCILGGQSFTPTSGVSCRVDFAQGTGTLSATSTSRDDLSYQITFTVGNGGFLDALSGAAPGSVATAHGMKLSPSGSHAHGKNGIPLEAMSAAMIAAANIPKIVCLEHHTKETDVHMVGDNGSCGTKPSGNAAFSSTTSWGGRSGTSWGFTLENASISQLSINANVPVFTE